MSRLSDLLNPIPSSTQSQETTVLHDANNRSRSHHRNQSITSPLEALAIAATSSLTEPSLTNAASPPTFSSNPSLPQPYSNGPSEPTHNYTVLPPPSTVATQPVSYSLYNQPKPPYPQAPAGVNGILTHPNPSTTFQSSDKVEVSQSLNGASQPTMKSMENGEAAAAAQPVSELKQEELRSENDASIRDEGLSQSIEKPQFEAQVQPREDSVSAIKQEILTPTMAATPAKSPPPVAKTPPVTSTKVAKPRATQKTEKKKTNGTTKKPAAKKRKVEVESRGDTPASHGSGTPNSNRVGKASAPKNVKQSSATPAQSSPPPAELEPEVEDEEEDEESDNELFCICRKPDDHTWMIGCDGGCEDWFHGRCVKMDQRDENLIDKYICPNCSSKKGIQTTWKPMCRLEGCRNAARVGGPNPSKYCCNEHGVQFMRQAVMNRASKEAREAPAKKRRKENYTDHAGNGNDEEPPHLRGGYLLPGEIKGLASSVTSIQEFKRLGDAVPASENGSAMDTDVGNDIESACEFSSQERNELEEISKKKAHFRHQLDVLADRESFLALVKLRAKSVLEELKKKEKNLKDICGFDKRLRWSPEDFDLWRQSQPGKEALKTRVLSASTTTVVDADGDEKMVDEGTDGPEEVGKGVCQRKRCKQHEGWYKLHNQELSFLKADGQAAIQKLDLKEKGIRERAVIRKLESDRNG